MIERLIPTNFQIPKDYRREFFFEDPSARFKYRIVADHAGIHVWDVNGPVPSKTMSMCLDWIYETMIEVRRELGAE